jgi:hypothetical protein
MTAGGPTGTPEVGACWCCGEQYASDDLVRLGCHDEVALCDGCIGWLAEQRGRRPMRRAVPILAATDISRALAHYAALGFETEEWDGGGYGFAARDGIELHLGQPEGFDPATNTISWYLQVADADALHAEWAAAAVAGELVAPFDTDYGMREGSHTDPDGNTVRFGSPLVGSQRTSDGSMLLAADDPVAIALTTAIQAGDIDALQSLLDQHENLANARIGSDDQSRTPLHIATDWPGHLPNVTHMIEALVDAGGDVNARFVGSHAETPLHWAASSDDTDAIDALLAAGADLEADGAVLGGGPPLADAVGFGQWKAARRLVELGATTRLKDAAALGLMDRVQAQFSTAEPPPQEQVTEALWAACHGGQRPSAQFLLARGADVNWIGWGELTALDVATQEHHDDLVSWLRAQGAKSADELSS